MWALEHSRTAHLTLDPPNLTATAPSAQPSASSGAPAYLKRLLAIREALAVRGDRPTTLTVLRSGKWAEFQLLNMFLLMLRGAEAGITEFSLLPAPQFTQLDRQLEYSGITQYLEHAATILTNLHTLTLEGCICVLPNPSLLPNLKRLVFNSNSKYAVRANQQHMPDAMCTSIANLLPQLTALTALGWHYHLPTLLPATHTCTQLTDLHISDWTCTSAIGSMRQSS